MSETICHCLLSHAPTPLTKCMDFYLIWGAIVTVECRLSLMSSAKLISERFPPNKSEGGYRRRINLHRRVVTTQQQKYFTACAYACAAILIGAELNNSADIGSETLAVSQSCNIFIFFFACNGKKMFICSVSCFASCAHCCLLVVFFAVFSLRLWENTLWMHHMSSWFPVGQRF